MDLVSSAGRKGGTRGGRDQFKWDDVKNDKHRENYLGHSLYAPVGRWQEGKDLTWYAKDNKDDEELKRKKKEELDVVKRRETELMKRALAGGSKTEAVKETLRAELGSKQNGDVLDVELEEKLRKESRERRREAKKLKKKLKKELKKEKKAKKKEEKRKRAHEWSSSSDEEDRNERRAQKRRRST